VTHKLFITEFASTVHVGNGDVISHPSGIRGSHALDIANPPTVSDYMKDGTTLVRVVADVNCSIGIGSDPAATLTKRGPLPLSANVPEIFGVAPGDRIAVIIR
jgi:hypothetical protein